MADHEFRLDGESVYLRPLTLKDATDEYLSWLQDDEVMSGIATSGYTLASLTEYIAQKLVTPGTVFCAICDKDNHRHIGNVKLDFHDRRANVSELGLLIGNKAYWGKGVGRQACRLLIRYGFDELKIRKIYLAVYENNPNAKRLYESLGFKHEGTLRKHIASGGMYYDKYLMGIFKEEFV